MKSRTGVMFIIIAMLFLLLTGCYKNSGNNKNSDDNTNENSNDKTNDKEDKDSSNNKDKDSPVVNKTEDNIPVIDDNAITFSHTGYFYNQDIKVEIISNSPCAIYYTLDGKEPDKEQSLYKDGISLNVGAEVKATCIKAKAFYDDGTESSTAVHTYFMGKNVEDRFDTLIFSITTDPYNLYDYEYGIFEEGKLRDEHKANNPWDRIEPNDPANYNMRGRESERPVYLEIIGSDGIQIASQQAGIRTYGGWSRANLQKSIKIYARKEYDELNNKLRYEFFPSKTAASGDGTILDSFKRLVLRNCGNDNGFAFIRDELFQTLAGQAGYTDYEAVRSAVMFINGDYRGHFWLHEVYCDEYFEENYGKYDGEFQILEGGETFKNQDDEDGNSSTIDDYEAMYSYAYKDLTDDNVFNELSELIDVENYLSYYALQIYIDNEDWPHNNYKTYRYYAAEGEAYREAPFDGKWRYLLHDLDFSFAIYGGSPQGDNIRYYMGSGGQTTDAAPLFGKLMQREDCKEIFIKKMLDLINGAFSPDNINSVLDRMNKERYNEQMHMYDKNLMADWVRPDQLEGRMEEIRLFGIGRAQYLLYRYRDFFKLDDIYTLSVKSNISCELKINSYVTKDNFEGNYYSNYSTRVIATAPAGCEFDYWLVNGKEVYSNELEITASMIADNKVDVMGVFKDEAANPQLIISEISSEGDNDYIVLYNPYTIEVSTKGYTLTDDPSEADKCVIPSRIVAPGESIRILGESNSSLPEGEDIRAEFNLKTGEIVTLYNKGKSIDTVRVPDLENDNIYRRDMYNMRFYEAKVQ